MKEKENTKQKIPPQIASYIVFDGVSEILECKTHKSRTKRYNRMKQSFLSFPLLFSRLEKNSRVWVASPPSTAG